MDPAKDTTRCTFNASLPAHQQFETNPHSFQPFCPVPPKIHNNVLSVASHTPLIKSFFQLDSIGFLLSITLSVKSLSNAIFSILADPIKTAPPSVWSLTLKKPADCVPAVSSLRPPVAIWASESPWRPVWKATVALSPCLKKWVRKRWKCCRLWKQRWCVRPLKLPSTIMILILRLPSESEMIWTNRDSMQSFWISILTPRTHWPTMIPQRKKSFTSVQENWMLWCWAQGLEVESREFHESWRKKTPRSKSLGWTLMAQFWRCHKVWMKRRSLIWWKVSGMILSPGFWIDLWSINGKYSFILLNK